MENSLEIGSSIKSIHDQMVNIPAGKIELRDDRKNQRWTVDIDSFFLAKYPVTQELYFAITQNSPFSFRGNKKPAENISWEDAIIFCNLLSKEADLKECYSISNDGKNITLNAETNGYRLPSDAEWEYACRAGTRKVRHGKIDQIAWYEENSDNRTHEVGKKEPNGWGLYDMLGNVWEWCWDLYDEEVYGSYRIFRGGGWCDPARGCLASNRRRSHPTYKIDDLGFRLARSL
jgi:formylglycine-generating enzyme required for sulfatase activity